MITNDDENNDQLMSGILTARYFPVAGPLNHIGMGSALAT